MSGYPAENENRDGPRQIVPHVPKNQHSNANHHNANIFTPSTHSLPNVTLKKLPFYEVLSDILKPTTLVGQEFCSDPKIRRPGMREVTFEIQLRLEEVNCIALNRGMITHGYPYQIQIRICALESTPVEITDFFPYELNIRINGNYLHLPPFARDNRRIPSPISCTYFFKLTPVFVNKIIVNWLPDSKLYSYIMAVSIVKKLSSSNLLERLHKKETKKTEDTKNYIIKKVANDKMSHWISLICPLSRSKINVPVKSTKCQHLLECFDAHSFLMMNEKKPTWLCPTCNKSCLYKDLQIQSYFLEVLSSSLLPDSCNTIELLADGNWRPCDENLDPLQSDGFNERVIDVINLDESENENSTD